MAKVLCVLYDDPVDGFPPAYGGDLAGAGAHSYSAGNATGGLE